MIVIIIIIINVIIIIVIIILLLQKLHNRVARILTNSAFDAPNSPLIKSLGWMSIADFISFESKQLVFKSLNSQAPQYICNLFQRNFRFQLMRLEKYCNGSEGSSEHCFEWSTTFFYRRATLRSNLKIEFRQAPTLSVFKKRLLSNKKP